MRQMLAFLLLTSSAGASATQYFATTGNYTDPVYDAAHNAISYTEYLDEMTRYGMHLDRVTLTDSADATVPGQLHGYQMAAIKLGNALNDAQQFTGQRKVIMDLFNVFFRIVDHSAAPVACSGYNSSIKVAQRTELRSDYQARLADFMSRVIVPISAANFEFISVNPESGCVAAADIQAAALAVKSFIPNVKVAAGYEISVDAPPGQFPGHGTNHIGQFPAAIDRIITWSYGVFDPANDANPLNFAPTFGSYYATLVGKLRPGQTIDWVIDGHYINNRHGTGMHWIQGTHHAQAEVNWCNWVHGQSRINGQLVFTYGPALDDPSFFSTAELPEIVRDTQANISVGTCALADTLVAADAFTFTTAGLSLNGRHAEVGGQVWIAGNALFGTGAQFDVTGTTGSNPMGMLPVTGVLNRPLTITADINPAGAEWAAIGFSGFANHGWFADGQIWVYLKNSNRYNVLVNGTATSLSGGERFDSKVLANQSNRVELTYYPATRSVAVRINGWTLLPSTPLPAGFTPATTYAGWSGLNVTQNQTRIDSFELRRH